MKMKESFIENLLLGKKHKKLLAIIYISILFTLMFYFAGKIFGAALYFATH
ncbi:hypothetical protein [Flavobacterium sp. HBTb2-11-1]|uniref:hypothetical protein n=1 Tax=Flavobacterium sp. HBTb2-11-1 TaxID=2692212 RepID=UPI00136B76E2|nr:hypothetical protein [Flavobacterium sp. HBTb2-11-1]MXO04045.1 hypothetical protein [Flavobacterium sp. HBTb2-11-1]